MDNANASHIPQLILASASPRRRELLDQIGVRYRVEVADIDEQELADESAEALVQRLAVEKAEAVWQRGDQQLPVMGADTLGRLDGGLLVKPVDYEDAKVMLLKMAGCEHEILSAVALRTSDGVSVKLSRSYVRFRDISEAEILAYWETGEPCDKAGAYAIQGYGAIFVAQMRGSYSGIMGLPLFETAALLAEAGIHPLSGR
ncbi:MAG: Septum formation protein Maf [uncultured Thiotrichaceae bacterium]|uniref:dTTP/UTP pyrophosphatase n=1 Tax=uncultured Thiotrichaceae bacterium TaxID=298394 RepID=A0A6S6TWJ7_9GAMM|nr:MAG: Septum formation protein Maf [uncultured Thiotrichaceae bacterium]